MSDRFQNNLPEFPDIQTPAIARPSPPLPAWLVSRVLRPGEEISWVFGPNFNPPWERYVTHPVLVLYALILGVLCGVAGALIGGGSPEAVMPAGLAGLGIVTASIIVAAFFSGYWTRLVVTDARLIVLQGYELVKSWSIDNLPASLVRYGKRKDGRPNWSIDLNSVSTMLGNSSGQSIDKKSILVFAKQVDRIRNREPDRTREIPESQDDTRPPEKS